MFANGRSVIKCMFVQLSTADPTTDIKNITKETYTLLHKLLFGV